MLLLLDELSVATGYGTFGGCVCVCMVSVDVQINLYNSLASTFILNR